MNTILNDLIELIQFMYSDISKEDEEKMIQFYGSNIEEYNKLKDDCIELSLAG